MFKNQWDTSLAISFLITVLPLLEVKRKAFKTHPSYIKITFLDLGVASFATVFQASEGLVSG